MYTLRGSTLLYTLRGSTLLYTCRTLFTCRTVLTLLLVLVKPDSYARSGRLTRGVPTGCGHSVHCLVCNRFSTFTLVLHRLAVMPAYSPLDLTDCCPPWDNRQLYDLVQLGHYRLFGTERYLKHGHLDRVASPSWTTDVVSLWCTFDQTGQCGT